MNKTKLLQAVITKLSTDLAVLMTAAKSSHDAATHAENIPDNKYDTLALEASYVAQGQANRARQIRSSIELYRQLNLLDQIDDTIQLGSLITLEAATGARKSLFIGVAEGGLRIMHDAEEIVVITVSSPIGRELLGRSIGDSVAIGAGTARLLYEIIEVS